MVLVGGDLSDAPSTVVSIAAWGPLEGPPLLRSGARAGDWAVVSGFPGRAAAGLRLRRLSRPLSGLEPEHARELLEAYTEPEPRVLLGRSLARGPRASAAIDVSDGLGMDAARLAAASGVRLVIERERLPVAPALASFARIAGLDPIELVLSGGDDYELLFAIAPADFDYDHRHSGLRDQVLPTRRTTTRTRSGRPRRAVVPRPDRRSPREPAATSAPGSGVAPAHTRGSAHVPSSRPRPPRHRSASLEFLCLSECIDIR